MTLPRTAFANPALARVLCAWAASSLSVWAFTILFALAADDAGGITALGLAVAVRTLPAALGGPYGALLADRHGRRDVLLLGLAVRAALLAALGLALTADAGLVAICALGSLFTLAGVAHAGNSRSGGKPAKSIIRSIYAASDEVSNPQHHRPEPATDAPRARRVRAASQLKYPSPTGTAQWTRAAVRRGSAPACALREEERRDCRQPTALERRTNPGGVASSASVPRYVDGIVDIGAVEIERTQQARWLSGSLAPEWKRRFPELFDEDDLRLAQGPQGPKGYHFVEWLAAIVLHHTTGYLSLVSKYEFRNHPAKQRVVAQLLAPEIRAALRDRVEYGSAQPPDLLMYAPDLSDWFFCEVKGPGDALRPEQVRKFDALAAMTGRPVRLLRLRWAPRRAAEGASPAPERAPREAAVTRAPPTAKRKGRVFDTESILAAAREPITEKGLAEATGYVEQYRAGTFRGLMKLYVRQGLMTRPTEDTVQTSST